LLLTRRQAMRGAGLAGVTVLAASCGTSFDDVRLTIATGGTQGVYYALGNALAQAWHERLPLGRRPQVLSTDGSRANLDLLDAGTADVVFSAADAAALNLSASVPDESRRPAALARLYDDVVHVVVRADSPAVRLADLRGLRVSVGAANSGVLLIAPMRVPWNRLGHPPAATHRTEEKASAATDLHALVEIIGASAAERGLPRPRRPWLPPLPIGITLSELGADGDDRPTADLAPVMVGLEDLPAAQAQRPATFDLVHGSHLLLSSAARSGRSSALRTIAGSLARSISPSDLHLYRLDFGNGVLLPLNDLPIAVASSSLRNPTASSA